MSLPGKLLLATRNPGKVREQKHALAGLELDIVGLEGWPDLPEPEEHGESFRDNARLKALYYHRATGWPAVGEDSGLEVDALGGAPGIQSARWMGRDTPYAVKNARLLDKLAGVPPEKRVARFVSAVALAHDGRIVFETVATCEGRIAESPRGTSGFGYDPVFFYSPLGKTLAELTPDQKHEVSHRGKAMKRLREFLKARRATP